MVGRERGRGRAEGQDKLTNNDIHTKHYSPPRKIAFFGGGFGLCYQKCPLSFARRGPTAIRPVLCGRVGGKNRRDRTAGL